LNIKTSRFYLTSETLLQLSLLSFSSSSSFLLLSLFFFQFCLSPFSNFWFLLSLFCFTIYISNHVNCLFYSWIINTCNNIHEHHWFFQIHFIFILGITDPEKYWSIKMPNCLSFIGLFFYSIRGLSVIYLYISSSDQVESDIM